MTIDVKIYGNSNEDLEVWWYYFNRISENSIYHSPDYIKNIEIQFGGHAELFVFGDDEKFIYYPYLKKRLSEISELEGYQFGKSEFYDISSSWYYGGPLINKQKYLGNTYIAEFHNAFSKYCLSTNSYGVYSI